jgi:hypothetical protein
MRARVLAAVLLLMLCFSATSNADQRWGPYTAEGIGFEEAVAAEGAINSMNAFVDWFESSLGPGHEALVMVGSTSWDVPIFEIEFWILVLDNPS